jgi:hypothetical protein
MGYNRAVVLPDGKGYAIFNSLTDEKVSETFATRDIAFAEKEKYAGNNYKVDLPDEAVARMLDWDKPLSQQPDSVRKALGSFMDVVRDGATKDGIYKSAISAGMDQTTAAKYAAREAYEPTGQHIVAALNEHLGIPYTVQASKSVSAYLRDSGIPGIKYLDEKSRAAGKGTSNFVLFDDKLARIIEVNGVETGVQPWQPGEWEATQGGERFSQEQPFSGREVAATPLKPGTTTLMVDGVERPAMNNNGKPIHWSEEGIRNFYAWFKDSKVVDEQGRPLVVYHGTSRSFNKFDTQMRGGFGGQAGFWFASNPEATDSFSRIQRDSASGPNIMPVYLSISNPSQYDGWKNHVESVRSANGDTIEKKYKSVHRDLNTAERSCARFSKTRRSRHPLQPSHQLATVAGRSWQSLPSRQEEGCQPADA